MKNFVFAAAAAGFLAWIVLRKDEPGSRSAAREARGHLNGIADQLAGKAKQVVGHATGDKATETEGVLQGALGKVVSHGIGKAVEHGIGKLVR